MSFERIWSVILTGVTTGEAPSRERLQTFVDTLEQQPGLSVDGCVSGIYDGSNRPQTIIPTRARARGN